MRMLASRRSAVVSQARETWEREWGERPGPEFPWYLDEAPPELRGLAEGERRPAGAALDLGCGDGVVTRYLAGSFGTAIGVDFALAALDRARSEGRAGPGRQLFVAAEAPRLPFRPASFAFVFDRGCLQNVPRRRWREYLREVDALLRPGGLFQLYCSREAARGWPGAGAVLRASLRTLRYGPGGIQRTVRRLLPRSLQLVEMRDFPSRLRNGKQRAVTYALARKTERGGG